MILLIILLLMHLRFFFGTRDLVTPFSRLLLLSSSPSTCNVEVHKCIVRPLAKQTRPSFSRNDSMSTSLFQLLYIDIWGPYKVPTFDGHRFFVTIVGSTM